MKYVNVKTKRFTNKKDSIYCIPYKCYLAMVNFEPTCEELDWLGPPEKPKEAVEQ